MQGGSVVNGQLMADWSKAAVFKRWSTAGCGARDRGPAQPHDGVQYPDGLLLAKRPLDVRALETPRIALLVLVFG